MPKEIIRCQWCKSDEQYVAYHDKEWGRQVKDDKTLFEFLVLESAQAGLSWITILRRRSAYQEAFANFDVNKVAAYTTAHVEALLKDSGIIKHRNKIESTITNAQLFKKVQAEYGSFYNYLYTFLPEQQPLINHWPSLQQVPATTVISDKIAKDMKKRGFKFFGSTICYAYMQAVGMVNDHIESCSFKY
ncbi:DNA-3-methyladenine glycosylase I [Sphingobacterium sp. HMA12]|jgi:DNA-3-methyladenine glycosylase I|uniref:DNA-3-methyladenine glycosylase I n=1 Tax=Sphingobacterium sp. HMA12 TaxID=2050894 RepID=UPI000CE9EF8A|nr:DNA-3-methyladenine glycosylase I [Sphingobacterium sp. HMA12]